ncbi:MAG: membrane protein insertase YidC [Nitrospiria bacterium]
MDKRLIIFITLSLVIIFLYPLYISWMTGPTQTTTSPDQPVDERATEAEQKPAPLEHQADEIPGDIVEPKAALQAEDMALQPPPSLTEETIDEVIKIVESDLYRIGISNIGGVIKSWELKKYTTKDGDSEKSIQLVPKNTKHFPLTMSLHGESNSRIAPYQLSASTLQLNKQNPTATVQMVSTSPSGQSITKEFRFHNDQYLIELHIETQGYEKGYGLSLGTNFGIHEWSQQAGAARGGTGAIALIDGEVIRDSPPKMEEDKIVHEGKAKWFGLQDKYFISALIPKGDKVPGPVSVIKKGDEGLSAQISIEDGDHIERRHFSLYAGPKEYDRLTNLKVNLDESIDFGWFIFGSWLPVRLISKPIFYLLRFFFKFTHNYGISIILVTVLVKVLFFPITRKSLRSMKAMSSIQPKMNAIRKKWADDKEKMNRELINLYKVEKVNPLGGCLPMLLQIPVFISLFNILYTTIDLRGAPFFLWVQDLSEPDPFYVLPIVMGATMFIQQYTQPSTMDPTQAKVMLFLPIVYTFFFLNFPSGLVLYWLVNNILTITQQHFIKKEAT